MFRKWLEIIFDHKISLRERMFRLVTGISMVALVFILVLGRSDVNLFILPLSLAYIYIAAKISIKNNNPLTQTTKLDCQIHRKTSLSHTAFATRDSDHLSPSRSSLRAGSTAGCLSGSCSASSISASPWREGGKGCSFCCV